MNRANRFSWVTTGKVFQFPNCFVFYLFVFPENVVSIENRNTPVLLVSAQIDEDPSKSIFVLDRWSYNLGFHLLTSRGGGYLALPRDEYLRGMSF